MTSTPFRVTFELERPLAAPSYPIHLDALLAWSRVQESLEAGDPEAWAAQDDLPLEHEGVGALAVWCASQLCYIPEEPPHNLTMTKTYELHAFARAHGRVYARGPKEISRKSGQYKSFVLEVPVQWVGRVFAYGIGDLAEVARLLERVHGLGKYTRLGLGAIARCRVEAWPKAAQAWRYRTLTVETPGYGAVEATSRPPYWDRTATHIVYRPLEIPQHLMRGA